MAFLEVRKFMGRTLDEVTRYLSVDLNKSLQDLHILLGKPRRLPAIYSVSVTSDSNLATSGNVKNLTHFELPAGDWHIVGNARFYRQDHSSFTVAQLWITALGPTTSGSTPPGDAIEGVNSSYWGVPSGTITTSSTAQWHQTITKTTRYDLEGIMTYSGGAVTPTYRCQMIAHGFTTERD